MRSSCNNNFSAEWATDCRKYRTDSRSVYGWSMGGHGAIKMSMLYSSAYAMSPAVPSLYCGWGATNPGFKDAQEIQTREALFEKGFDGIAIGSS